MLIGAAAVALAVVVTQAGGWLAAAAELARSPLVPVLAGVALTGLVALLLTRHHVTRRVLLGRVRFLLLPADSFEPTPEAVARFASGLVRSRRLLAGLLEARASAVRVQLDTATDQRLRYVIEIPAHARAALRAAASAYGAVELHELPRNPHDRDKPGEANAAHVARTELVLAHASAAPLHRADLDPDPLAAFARALAPLRPGRGETGSVCVDLLALTPARRRRHRRRLLRHARHHPQQPTLGAVLDTGRTRRGPAAAAELVERRGEQRALASKLGSPEPLFTIQVLLHVRAASAARAKQTASGLLAAFSAWDGENHFRAAGIRLPGGAVFLGADAPWRRRRFDRRLRSGRFAPARRRVVTAGEIAGLLKPPTAACTAPNVLRSGGVIPPPPPGLPTFAGQPGLLPLGQIATEDGERMVGVPLEGTFFSYMAGRSRYGKTETALCQLAHLARSGHGCFFLDPHEDAIHRVKRYLARQSLRDRVVEINLAGQPATQAGWNLLAGRGRPAEQVVDAVVDALASTLRWDETNSRALNLTTQAAQALVELSRRLPAELAPTVFQIPTLLGDDDWRAAVLPHVAPATRRFFTDRFPRLTPEAITPVTNLIDRLRASPAAAALLGSPTSSYDIRAAMDRGQVVLACPGSGSTRDRLIANFLVYDLLHAAKSRAAIAPEYRRPFFVFLDEVQTYDGASGGNLAALLEQTAKYGIRAFLFNQNPERLTAETLNAVTTNRSHLFTTAVNATAARLLARECGKAIEPETITRLARYTYLASVTLAGETSPPFLVRGVPLEDLWPDEPDETAALQAAIEATTGRWPVRATLDALEDHDERILQALTPPAGGGDGQDGASGGGHKV